MRGKELQPEQRAYILGLKDGGLSREKIAAKTGFKPGAVQSTIRRREKGLSTTTAPRSGRPLKSSVQGARLLGRNAQKNRRHSIWALAHKTGSISGNTARRMLYKLGIRKYKAVKKPGLRPSNRLARLQFARRHRNWTVDDWRKVVWTDETSVSTAGGTCPVWVFRKPWEKLLPACVRATYKSGAVSVMMWGAFQGSNKGPLVRVPDGRINAEKYVALLAQHGLPWIRTLEPGAIFMQDNAPVHTAGVTTAFLTENGLRPMRWPPQSPDLNPIENLWYVLKCTLQKNYPNLASIPGGPAEVRRYLEQYLVGCWEGIEEELLERYIVSMPDRIQAVLKAKGSWTKY